MFKHTNEHLLYKYIDIESILIDMSNCKYEFPEITLMN